MTPPQSRDTGGEARTRTFPSMPDIVPEGSIGTATVSHFEIDRDSATLFNLRAARNADRSEVRAGRYARLHVAGSLYMSDTPMERQSNMAVLWSARGDVLIAGLGLGMILLPILAKPEVRSVLVIEKSADVVALVEPAIRAKCSEVEAAKLRVLVADIYDWKPPAGESWDTIYFDIWADICTDSLGQMTRLHRKFARRKRGGGWMASWQRDFLRYRQRQEKREEERWNFMRRARPRPAQADRQDVPL